MSYRVLALVTFVACATEPTTATPSGSPTDGGCAGLCIAAGFDGGTEQDYDPVYECLCEGDGDGLDATACASYCAEFGVSAENSLLSTEITANDKCVCDGTAG